MNYALDFLSPAAPQFLHDQAATAELNVHDSAPDEVSALLADLLRDESVLYALTRDWRYDTAVRKILGLHALLNEQFTEIGLRLVKLAARSRALGLRVSMGHQDRSSSHISGNEDELQARLMGELLERHEALLLRMRPAKTMTNNLLQDPITTELLADLIAKHEKDAFMLRALLREVQNTAT